MTVPAFLEQRLDPAISEGARGGPIVPGRTKTYLPNGALQQNFSTTLPLHKYDVSYALRSAADFQIILDIFYVVMFTPYLGFRFKDWRDYLATQANTRLTFITGTTWQLQRVYTFATIVVLRDIFKPCASPAPVIKRTRSAVVTTATATVDTTTGIATISGHAGGDTYTWEGEFDVPVQFTDDEWPSTLEVNVDDLHVQSASIALEEIRL